MKLAPSSPLTRHFHESKVSLRGNTASSKGEDMHHPSSHQKHLPALIPQGALMFTKGI